MMPFYLIQSEIHGKITGPYRSQRHTKYEVTCSVKRNKYPKYDVYLFDSARDIQQNIGHGQMWVRHCDDMI